MKTIIATLLLLASTAVMADEWVPVDSGNRPVTKTFLDNTTHTYHVLYSPASVVRHGDVVSVSVEAVFTDTKPTMIHLEEYHCATHQYRYRLISPDQQNWIDWKAVPGANTPGSAIEAIVCAH